MNSDQPLALIGAAFGWGAQRPETEWGPRTLQKIDLEATLAHYRQAFWQKTLLPQIRYTGTKLDYKNSLQQIQGFAADLAQEVITAYQQQYFPVILGGDHSVAIGTWSGVTTAMQAAGKFGLIWIDAHMDAHTPQTTPSHNIHGMPLAVLLGHGEKSLVDMAMPGPKLDPRHVVLIGVRSFEAGEAALLKALNVKIYFREEVAKIGFAQVLQQAIEHVTQGTLGFGISIDLDVFDPAIAPGTGALAPNGLTDKEVLPVLRQLTLEPKFKALEIVEFDPIRDKNHQTAYLIQDLILNTFGLTKDYDEHATVD